MSLCPNCPQIPVVSKSLALERLQEIPEVLRPVILMDTLEWLTERHEGLNIYEGICGRAYTEKERDTLGPESGIVAGLLCPYYRADGEGGRCLFGGLGPKYNRVQESGRQQYGWLPTLVASAWDPNSFRALIRAKQVADAKVMLLTRNEAFVSKDEHGRIYVG